MLFWCVEDTRGCEWQGLRGLVRQYNQLFDTKYKHVECVDVTNRID